MRRILLSATILVGLFGTATLGLAQKWTPKSVPWNRWISVTSSADGTRLVVAATNGPIYVSANSGLLWTQASLPSYQWSSVVESADGRKMAIASQNGPVYLSTNGGSAWFPSSGPPASCNALGSTSDATKLLAGSDNGPIYISTNWGATWAVSFVPSAPYAYRRWHFINCSADGTTMVGTTIGDYVGGGWCYYSTNSGASWQNAQLQGINWGPIAASSDGKLMVNVYSGRWVVTSTNSGKNWNMITIQGVPPAPQVTGMAVSADLKFMAIGLPGVPICTSTNSGATWKAEDGFPAQWSSIAGSADASKLVAVSLDGAIFTYQAVPTLSIAVSGSNAILTWTASGADFDLQQTSDVRAPTWITVTDAPVVINGQSQVTLPVTTLNYFRLKSR